MAVPFEIEKFRPVFEDFGEKRPSRPAKRLAGSQRLGWFERG
jgi:hypothetical protein